MMTGNGSPVVDHGVVAETGLGQDGDMSAAELVPHPFRRKGWGTDRQTRSVPHPSLREEWGTCNPRDLLGFFKGMHSAEDDDLDEDDVDDDDDHDDLIPGDADDLDDDEEDEDDDDDEDLD